MSTLSFISSLNTQQQLDKTQRLLNRSIERLSSGLRINSAKDDAAGSAIANRMTSQLRGEQQAARNTNDGISVSATAEGALSEINDRLQRVRELTVQGLNGTLSGSDSDAIQQEINLNLKEIDRLASQSQFNGLKLLDGSSGTVNVQVGANDGQTLGIDLNPPGFSVDELGLKNFTVAGIPGSVRDINVVQGAGDQIPVADLSFSAGLANPVLMTTSQTGYGGSYVRSGSEGSYTYHKAYVSALHDTATDTNSGTISAGSQLFKPVDNIGTTPIEAMDVSLRDASNGELSSADHQLVKTGSQYYIQQGSGAEALYYSADVETLPPKVHAQVTSNDAVWPPATVTSYQGELLTGASNDYLDNNNQPVEEASLTHVGDRYYLTTQDENGNSIYREATVTQTAEGSYQVKASTDQPATAPVTTAVPRIDGQKVNGAEHLYLDASGNTSAFRDATLTSDGNGQYYLEQNGRYYTVDAASLQSDKPKAIVTAQSNTALVSPEKAITTEKETVRDSSRITLDPSNVSVSYTNTDGTLIDDALRVDSDGQYYLRASPGDDGTPGYKSATLVESDDGRTLLKTRNGSGDVILYYEFIKSASTDVPTNRSTVHLREVGSEIRLKHPDDPLATLDRAIARVDDKRSQLGATQNRMASILDQQAQDTISLSQARSRIVDADYAVEVSNMSRAQILQQAGTAVLTQANQTSQSVLSLLQKA